METFKVFVAKSFRPEDQARIKPIEDFLETFKPNGLECLTAERAEAERISDKVRYKIDACDLFVGVMTRRYPVLRSESFAQRMKALFSQVTDWSAPPWILQESGYALKAGKTLILFKENGVDVGGLEGDLEFIPYEAKSPSVAITRASSMVNGLMSRRLGIAVETDVVVRPIEPDALRENVARASSQRPTIETAENAGLNAEFELMRGSFRSGDWESAEAAYERGKTHATNRGEANELRWTLLYHSLGVNAGKPSSMAALNVLAAKNPEHSGILAAIGNAFLKLAEHRKAADYFLRAAASSGSTAEESKNHLRAGECFERAKEYDRALESFERSITLNTEEGLLAINGASRVLAEQGKHVAANAIAEYSLSEDPTQSDLRFSLGLGYDKQGEKRLYLYHFAILAEQSRAAASAIHNLAVGYHDLELPILAYSNYERALREGETLSASNMSYRLMDTGDADRAEDILRQALTAPHCEPAVGRALSDLHDRKLKENERSLVFRQEAEKIRALLVRYGAARLLESECNVSGTWTFPFAEITLTQHAAMLRGTGEAESVNVFTGILSALGTLSAQASPGRYLYTVTGTMTRMSAEIVIAECPLGTYLEETREALVVFENGGTSGQVAELSLGKITKTYKISRKAPAV